MVKQEQSSRIGALEVWGNISRGNVWRRRSENKKERHFWNRRTEKEREQKYLRRKQKNNMIALERLKKVMV